MRVTGSRTEGRRQDTAASRPVGPGGAFRDEGTWLGVHSITRKPGGALWRPRAPLNVACFVDMGRQRWEESRLGCRPYIWCPVPVSDMSESIPYVNRDRVDSPVNVAALTHCRVQSAACARNWDFENRFLYPGSGRGRNRTR